MNPVDILSGYKFVMTFYSIEVENMAEMDIMFQLGNEYIIRMLETNIGTDKIKSEQMVAETIVRLGDLTTKMCHYFEQSSGFWEKLELSISFIRALITIITKVNQISSFENLENFDEERLLKVLILRFEEVLIRSESPVIDKLRILLGCAIQSMCGMGLNGSSIALRLDFPGRLTNELAKIQIKISLIKFRQLSETSYGQLIFIIFSIMRNMVYKQRALKECGYLEI